MRTAAYWYQFSQSLPRDKEIQNKNFYEVKKIQGLGKMVNIGDLYGF